MDSQHLRRTLGWDGVCPLVVAMIPSLLVWCFAGQQNGPGLVALAGEVLPFVFALARAHISYRQLVGEGNIRPPISRQLILTLAILILLAFEVIAIRIQTVPGAPISAYVAATGLYLAYFILALFAFRPLRSAVE